MHEDGSGNDLSDIGDGGYSVCITKGQSEIHISSWFGLWMCGAALAVSNITSKWVCSPHWEAKSIKQLLWHLENQFTMIETIQLKPPQSVFPLSQVPLLSQKLFLQKRGNLHMNTKITSLAVGMLAELRGCQLNLKHTKRNMRLTHSATTTLQNLEVANQMAKRTTLFLNGLSCFNYRKSSFM